MPPLRIRGSVQKLFLCSATPTTNTFVGRDLQCNALMFKVLGLRLEINQPMIQPRVEIPVPPSLPPRLPDLPAELAAPKITSSRVAATSRYCMFLNCHESERLMVPKIREMILIHNKIYVPNCARIIICRHHLDNGNWNDLSSN